VTGGPDLTFNGITDAFVAKVSEGGGLTPTPTSTPTASTPTPTPAAGETPTSVEQCKDGGWRNFTNPRFKNQGDCVSFVASGGRARGNL